jgi:putative membrane protein
MSAVDPTPPQLPAALAREIHENPKDAATLLAIYRTRLAVYRTDVANLRSHLANERTHLAYLRTAISLIGFGITLNRFSLYLIERDLAPASTPLPVLRDTGNVGLGMVILGLLLLGWSLFRYWRVSQDVERGRYVSRYRATAGISLALLLLGGAAAVWLFVQ